MWGENTKYARLIHLKNNSYLTGNCKFDDQDIFAVSLYLRTGNTKDFAFVKSISNKRDPIHGLPEAAGFPGYITQNPECVVDNKVWFEDLDEVWKIV